MTLEPGAETKEEKERERGRLAGSAAPAQESSVETRAQAAIMITERLNAEVWPRVDFGCTVHRG